MEWIYTRLQGSEGLVERASRRLVRDEELITQWSPATLRIELDRWLWKDQDHLSAKQLWEYLASYLYLPRLRNAQVLVDAIRNGASPPTFPARLLRPERGESRALLSARRHGRSPPGLYSRAGGKRMCQNPGTGESNRIAR